MTDQPCAATRPSRSARLDAQSRLLREGNERIRLKAREAAEQRALEATAQLEKTRRHAASVLQDVSFGRAFIDVASVALDDETYARLIQQATALQAERMATGIAHVAGEVA